MCSVRKIEINSQLKTRRKASASRRRSLLPSKGHVSDLGESVVVRFIQSGLFCFGDKAEKSDNDPAMVKAVEMLSVAGTDTTRVQQEEETRTVRGILSL